MQDQKTAALVFLCYLENIECQIWIHIYSKWPIKMTKLYINGPNKVINLFIFDPQAKKSGYPCNRPSTP